MIARLAACLPVLVAAGLFLPGLGATDFTDSDEPRYAQATREMMESGDPLRLTVNGEPYLKKPPLLMWAQAGAATVVGRLDEGVARLPSALAGIAVVLVTQLLGHLLFGPRAGWWAALLLAVAPAFVLEARVARMDVLLTLFVATSFLGFARWERGEGRPGALALCLLPLPLGVLTKWTGPLFFLLPAGAYLLITGQFRRLASPAGAAAVAAAIALSLAPFALVSDLGEFGRVIGGSAHQQPFWFHLLRLPLVSLPAFLLVPTAIFLLRRRAMPTIERRGVLLVATWVVVGVLLLSLSSGKRSNYLDPLIPGVALIAGWAAARRLSEGRARVIRAGLWRVVVVVVCLILVWVHIRLPGVAPEKSVRALMTAFRDRAGPEAPLYWVSKPSASVKKPGPEFVFYGERPIKRLRGKKSAWQLARDATASGETIWILMPMEVYDRMTEAPFEGVRLRLEVLSGWPKRRYVIVSNRDVVPEAVRFWPPGD